MRRSTLIAIGAVIFGICGTLPHLAFAYGEYGPFWSDVETRMLVFVRPPIFHSVASAVMAIFFLWAAVGAFMDAVVLALPFAKRATVGMQWALVTVTPPFLLAALFLISPFERTF